MKKVIALALALVLALSLGVAAFADVTPVKLVSVKEDKTADDGYTLIESIGFTADNLKANTWYTDEPEGGAFYTAIVIPKASNTDLKDIVIEKDGNVVAAELVAYDPAKYTTSKVDPDNDEVYEDWDGIGNEKYYAVTTYTLENGTKETKYLNAGGSEVDEAGALKGDWDEVKAAYDAYYKNNTSSANLNSKKHNYSILCDSNIYLFKITVAENYGVNYTEGMFQIKATKVEGRTKTAMKSDKITVIADVAVWDYDTVIGATKAGIAFDAYSDDAYSDYKTALETYLNNYKNTGRTGVYMNDSAIVVSTTEFRAINDLGEGLTVNYGDRITGLTLVAENSRTGGGADGNVSVVIDKVAQGQKGVNFWMDYKENRSESKWGKLTSIDVDFKGKDVIASDATIEIDLPYTNVELLNDFGKKVEEEDIVTYYILKDGKLAGQFTVDYLKDTWDDQVKFDIAVKAGEALGKYTVALAVPAAGAEENPNTGAESVIGVVAAMAAVSVVAAAAVSLKK